MCAKSTEISSIHDIFHLRKHHRHSLENSCILLQLTIKIHSLLINSTPKIDESYLRSQLDLMQSCPSPKPIYLSAKMDRSRTPEPTTKYPDNITDHANLLKAGFDRCFEHSEKFGSFSKWLFRDLSESYTQLREKILKNERMKEAGNSTSESIEDQRIVSGSQILSCEEKARVERYTKDEKGGLANNMPHHLFDQRSGSHFNQSNMNLSGSPIKSSEPIFPILSYWVPEDQVEHVKTLKQNFEAVHNYVNSCPTATIPSYFHNLLYHSYLKLSDKLLGFSADDSQAETDVPTINTFSTRTQTDLQPTVDKWELLGQTLKAPHDAQSYSSANQPPLSEVTMPSEGDLGLTSKLEVKSVLGGHDTNGIRSSRDSSSVKTNVAGPTAHTNKLNTASVFVGDVHSLQQLPKKSSAGFGVEIQNVNTFPMEKSGEKAAVIRKIVAANASRIRSLTSVRNIKHIGWINPSSCEKRVSAILIRFATAKQANEVIWSGLKLEDKVLTCRKWPTIGKPIQCTNCQTYGHNEADCKSPPICALCAAPHPTRGCRTKLRLCVLCGGGHAANFSESCQKLIEYKRSLKFWPEESKDNPPIQPSASSATWQSIHLPASSAKEPAEDLAGPPPPSKATQSTHASSTPDGLDKLLSQIEEIRSKVLAYAPHTSSPLLAKESDALSSFVQPEKPEQNIESQSTPEFIAHRHVADDSVVVSLNIGRSAAQPGEKCIREPSDVDLSLASSLGSSDTDGLDFW